MSQAGIIVKVTRLCNLRCTYCLDWRATGPPMSFTVLAHLVSSALANFDNVQFIWHGGEPTLVPIEFFQKAMALQARYLRSGCTVRNDFQTNATRIDDRWAQFFKSNSFGVGVSLDGPPELQNRQRPRIGGKPSYEHVIRGITTLRRHDIPVSVLMVVDDDTLALGPDAVFDFFLSLGIKKYGCLAAKPHVNPSASPGTPARPYVEPKRMTEFLCRLYDRWLSHGDSEIQIRELHAILSRLTMSRRGFCTLEGNCLGHYFIAEPNGEIAHCDLFLGDPAYSFGNILNTGFEEICHGAKLNTLKSENACAVAKLSHCAEYEICMGGCPHDRYISYRHNSSHTEECCGLRELIAYVRSRIPRAQLSQAASASRLVS